MSGSFVFVSAVCPYPADSGKKVFIGGLLRYAIEKLGPKKVNYLLIGSLDAEKTRNFQGKFGINVIHVGRVRTGEVLRNVLYSFLEENPKSFQECVLFSRTIRKTLFDKIREINPSIVIMDTIRIGQYFESERPLSAKYILYMEDLFSVRYKRMLESSSDQGVLNAAGNFISNIPLVFRGLLNSKMVERILLNIELKRVSKRESLMPGKFDLNLLLNKDDVDRMHELFPTSLVQHVPPLFQLSPTIERLWDGKPFFVFIGDLKVSENSVSLEVFLKKCLKPTLAKIPDFKLFIIGKGIPPSLRMLVDEYPKNLEYLGFVEDIDNILSKSAAMLIPMLYGSGIRFKALDAFVRGLPVISTPLGVEGLGLDDLDVCLISKRIEEMPDLITASLDQKTNLIYSNKGRRYFSEKFSFKWVSGLYDSILESR